MMRNCLLYYLSMKSSIKQRIPEIRISSKALKLIFWKPFRCVSCTLFSRTSQLWSHMGTVRNIHFAVHWPTNHKIIQWPKHWRIKYPRKLTWHDKVIFVWPNNALNKRSFCRRVVYLSILLLSELRVNYLCYLGTY